MTYEELNKFVNEVLSEFYSKEVFATPIRFEDLSSKAIGNISEVEIICAKKGED